MAFTCAVSMCVLAKQCNVSTILYKKFATVDSKAAFTLAIERLRNRTHFWHYNKVSSMNNLGQCGVDQVLTKEDKASTSTATATNLMIL